VLDEWTGLDIASEQELIEAFVPKFYFGCEADDSSVAWAFNRELNPDGSRLQAMFSSDAGHWDVSDMTEVLVEAYELVEHGHISDADFKDFVFTFPASFYGGLNRNFFRGTRVEHAAAALLKPQA
jgi:hypothetical protein